jgi:hypothetical protein
MLRGDHLAQCSVVKPVAAGLIVTVNDRILVAEPTELEIGGF